MHFNQQLTPMKKTKYAILSVTNSCFLLTLLLLSACTKSRDVSILDCEIFSPNDSTYIFIYEKMHTTLDERILLQHFNVAINSDNAKTLVDVKNNWQKKYSSCYFQVKVNWYDDNYVLVHCGRSGIGIPFDLCLSKDDDLYLLDRKNGNVIKHIILDTSPWGAIFHNKKIYTQYGDPPNIRVCDF